jgi:hypothetical protein
VLAIIRRCLQTGRRAHAPCQWVLQTRRRQTFCEAGFQNSFDTRRAARNALRSWPAGRIVRKEGFREQGRRIIGDDTTQAESAMTKTEMLETMKRLGAHANALLLIGASDIDLLGGMFDVMPDFKALLDAGYGEEIERKRRSLPRPAPLRRHALKYRRRDRGRLHPVPR